MQSIFLRRLNDTRLHFALFKAPIDIWLRKDLEAKGGEGWSGEPKMLGDTDSRFVPANLKETVE